MKKIRVPATTVQLVQILGVILRENLKIRIYGEHSECWTFEHVTDWEVPVEPPKEGADQAEWEHYEWQSVRGEHEMSVYLGSGHCSAFSSDQKVKRLELRVRCEHSTWVATSLRMWDFQIWGKFADESVWRHHFSCHLGYGTDRTISSEKLSDVAQNPPKKIAFWRKAESKPTGINV